MAQLKFTLHIQRKDGKAQAQAQEVPDVFFETHNQITFAWLSEGVPATRPLHNSTIALHPNGVSISGFERESDTFHFQEWWLIPQTASVIEGIARPEESKTSVVAAPEEDADAPFLPEEEEPILEEAERPVDDELMAAAEEAPEPEVEEPAPMVEEEMAAAEEAPAPEAEDGFGEEAMMLPEDDLPLATQESVEEEMALEEEDSATEPDPTPPEEAVSVAQAAAKLQQVIAAGRNEAADEAEGEPKKSLEDALSGALDAAFGDEDLSSQLDSALGVDEEKPKD